MTSQTKAELIEALANLISLADPHFSDATQLLALRQARKALAALRAEPAGEPVPWQSVVSAIRAVGSEAYQRGSMFPQAVDEHREDRAAVRRVAEMIEWYATNGGAVAESLKDWPKVPTHPPSPSALAEVPKGLIAALRWQRQIDADGMEVGVSREAVDTAADILEKLSALPPVAGEAK